MAKPQQYYYIYKDMSCEIRKKKVGNAIFPPNCQQYIASIMPAFTSDLCYRESVSSEQGVEQKRNCTENETTFDRNISTGHFKDTE